MQNYNETSFALVGILENVDDAVLNFSFGNIGLGDMQQNMLNMANAVSAFATADSTAVYTSLATPAQSFVTNYTNAPWLSMSEVQDFQNLMSTTYGLLSQDPAVASSASRAFTEIQLHSQSVAWSALIDGTANTYPSVITVNSASPFIDIFVADNYIFINWEMDQSGNGYFDSSFEYDITIQNSDESEAILSSEMYVYADYTYPDNPILQVESGSVEYMYIA